MTAPLRPAAPDWTPLNRELAAWAAEGRVLPLWWRDDDAIAPTPALDRLSDLSRDLGLPVHLAVIPRDATPALADWLVARPHLVPVVHGWAHANHAPPGGKKAEFGDGRPPTQALADARRGLVRLQDLLGDRLVPLFVPPWNRIAPPVVAGLPDLGVLGLSTFTPRGAALAARGLLQVNTHLDPIDWRGSRGLADPDRLVAQVAAQLADRRLGRADPAEPYGILTHHLVHDAAIWSFTAALVSRLLDGPGQSWQATRHTLTPPRQEPET